MFHSSTGQEKDNIRSHIRRRLGPHKRLFHLDRHPLLRLGSPNPPVAPSPHWPHARDFLLLDIASYANHTDTVHPLEVIAHVEFVEAQRDVERRIAGWEEGCPDESDCEVGADGAC